MTTRDSDELIMRKAAPAWMATTAYFAHGLAVVAHSGGFRYGFLQVVAGAGLTAGLVAASVTAVVAHWSQAAAS